MKVFITRKIADEAIKLLEQQGHNVTIWEEKRNLTQEELIAYCNLNDALLCAGPSRINKEFLNSCAHLKVIALHSVGYDQVDIAAATQLKIPVGNTPGVLSSATADTAFLLMLAVSRKAFYMHKKVLNGEWNFFEPMADLGIELRGKTLGVFGLGKIGFEMAKRCVGAYDMKIIYHNRGVNEAAEKVFGAKKVSFEELLIQSDVLTLHTALTDETRGVFTLDIFRKMKQTAIFVNTARGAIHNELDLLTALKEQMIWGAGLDVTNPEPMSKTNELLNMSNVAVLPHIGSATEETRAAMSVMAVNNIIAGLKNERLPFVVNPEVYDGLN